FSCVMVYGNFRLKPNEASVLSVALFVPQGLNRIHTSRTPCRIGAENQTNRHGYGERKYRRPGRDDCREIEEMVHEVGEPNPQPDADQTARAQGSTDGRNHWRCRWLWRAAAFDTAR